MSGNKPICRLPREPYRICAGSVWVEGVICALESTVVPSKVSRLR